MKRIAYILFGITSTLLLLPSCNKGLIYDKYEHTPISGWEKNDELSFEIPPLPASGHYKEELGLRITGAYPFMGLTLIVEQTIYPSKSSDKELDKVVKADTIQCDLIDKSGVTKGQGISYYQYNVPINIYQMNENDSIHISVRHDMKREILPGVSDIGIKISGM